MKGRFWRFRLVSPLTKRISNCMVTRYFFLSLSRISPRYVPFCAPFSRLVWDPLLQQAISSILIGQMHFKLLPLSSPIGSLFRIERARIPAVFGRSAGFSFFFDPTRRHFRKNFLDNKKKKEEFFFSCWKVSMLVFVSHKECDSDQKENKLSAMAWPVPDTTQEFFRTEEEGSIYILP